jgi:hypothetical protein
MTTDSFVAVFRRLFDLFAARQMRYPGVLIVSSAFLGGCFNSEVVRPESLETDATHDIVVSTHDSRTIRLSGGDYHIVKVGENKLLRGKGELYLNERRTETKRLELEIPLSEITSIETRDKTFFHYIAPFIIGSAVVAVLLLALALQGKGFGG